MPLATKNGNDSIFTPDWLAERVVRHFLPHVAPGSSVLDPCCGGGAFVRAFGACGLGNSSGFDIEKSPGFEAGNLQDFLAWGGRADWIITNPPWSKIRAFLKHSYEVAHEVVFLALETHLLGCRARNKDAAAAGFRPRGVLLLDNPPKPWPQTGLQLCACWFSKGWGGPVEWAAGGGEEARGGEVPGEEEACS